MVHTDKTIILISTNISEKFGGEAIKAWQYAKHLQASGYDFLILSHGRCADELAKGFPPNTWHVIPDGGFQILLWKSVIFRNLLGLYFHWCASRLIDRLELDPASCILHYIAPISPVALRLPPRDFDLVMGPLSGNIYYPPAFSARMPFKDRLRERLHAITQRILGRLFPEKRQARVLLVSGYERTKESLLLAGASVTQFIDVVDSGVADHLADLPRHEHAGESFDFVCIGRLIDVKAFDLAIKALAQTTQRVHLHVYGTGDALSFLQQTVRELNLADHVTFHGWIDHDQILEAYRGKRGFIFPSLADSNGIVVQEAMMIGLPVVALNWGGPAMLADDQSAIYIEPDSEAHVVTELARAMDRLATNGAEADRLAARAREIAETRFRWEAVASSWAQSYRKLEA
ncbi:MAG: glycosyltransferase family 4 protein [Paracoccaceae bacterium]